MVKEAVEAPKDEMYKGHRSLRHYLTDTLPCSSRLHLLRSSTQKSFRIPSQDQKLRHQSDHSSDESDAQRRVAAP